MPITHGPRRPYTLSTLLLSRYFAPSTFFPANLARCSYLYSLFFRALFLSAHSCDLLFMMCRDADCLHAQHHVWVFRPLIRQKLCLQGKHMCDITSSSNPFLFPTVLNVFIYFFIDKKDGLPIGAHETWREPILRNFSYICFQLLSNNIIVTLAVFLFL